MNIRIRIAIIKYPRTSTGHIFQFLYNQETDTTLAASSTEPRMTTDQNAAENMVANPTIEKYPAITDNAIAIENVI